MTKLIFNTAKLINIAVYIMQLVLAIKSNNIKIGDMKSALESRFLSSVNINVINIVLIVIGY
jgi:hypothetical protein